MHQVDVAPVQLDRLAGLLAPERWERLRREAGRARAGLAGRTVWNVNATAQGGGVAEMLQNLLAYGRGAGVDTRWLVLSGTPDFFAITKRVHNVLHGTRGDGGSLGESEHASYEAVLRDNVDGLSAQVRPGDVVLLHDPQTAGMVDAIRSLGATTVWRCHIGRDTPNELSRLGWEFLRPYLVNADHFVFSRLEYAPDWVPRNKLTVIAPSIDPFSAKNRWLEPDAVATALAGAGLVSAAPDSVARPFVRRDGTIGTARPRGHLIYGDDPPPADAGLVVQISRWDRLKDMGGVLTGFVEAIDALPERAHLMLVGPDVSGVTDDPEGQAVLGECQQLWDSLPSPMRRRVHLTTLPMDDVDENAYLVNALQHQAAVVVQKSLVEGFGLTVTEAMWKARPVVASAVGGINDQIVDGRDGILVHDPTDLHEFGSALATVLGDPDLAKRLGAAARARVQDRFLGDRHLIQYVELFSTMTP
jgi:trehalose synthase